MPGPPIAVPTAAATAATAPAPGVAMSNTTPLPAAVAASSHTSTSTPAPADPPGVLPAWTGLPHPPLWLKAEEKPQGGPSKSSTNPASNVFFTGDGAATGGTGHATTTEAGRQAVEGGGEAGAWSGGIGEKRPRWVFHVFIMGVENMCIVIKPCNDGLLASALAVCLVQPTLFCGCAFFLLRVRACRFRRRQSAGGPHRRGEGRST